MVKRRSMPMAAPSRRRTRAQRAWKVPTATARLAADQVGDAMGQDARLAAPRSGQDQERPFRGPDGARLLLVEARPDRRLGRLPATRPSGRGAARRRGPPAARDVAAAGSDGRDGHGLLLEDEERAWRRLVAAILGDPRHAAVP